MEIFSWHYMMTESKSLFEPESQVVLPAVRKDHDWLAKPSIGVLSNPLSGGNKRGLRPIEKLLAGRPDIRHQEARNPVEIDDALAAFGRAGVNLLVLNGGDGTIQAALTSLFTRGPFPELPLLAVLKAGTTSMTAGDIGLKGRKEKALLRLLQHLDSKKKIDIAQRPVLEVQHDEKTSRFGMFFGGAVIPQGIEFFHRRINRHGLRGEFGPGLVMIRFLLAMLGFQRRKIMRPVPMAIQLNQQQEKAENHYLIVLVSALERLFFGLHPYWGKEKEPLHFTSVNDKARQLPAAVFKLALGRPPVHAKPESGYRSHNVTQVKIFGGSPYTLDGQLYHPDSAGVPTIVRHGGTISFVRLRS
jgi:diacylglycerol kinase family enzyme